MSILAPFGLTQEHFDKINEMKTNPNSFGFQNQFDYAKASGKDLVDRSAPGFGIASMLGQVAASPFYDTYQGIQKAKEPYEKDFTQYSGITDYGEIPVGPSLSEVAKGISDQKIGTMMGGRFIGGLESLFDTGKNYASKISDAVISPAYAPNLDINDIQSRIEAAKAREALNAQGLLSLDDAGLVPESYEQFAQVAKPGFNKQFAKQLGYSALGLITGNPLIGLIARGLGSLAGRGGLTGVRGGADLRGDTTFNTFRRSTSLADFMQRQRDKRAREEAAARGAAKQKAKNLDYEYDAYTGGGGGGGIGSSYGGSASPGSQGPGGSDAMGSF
jgi:hypothetical protein